MAMLLSRRATVGEGIGLIHDLLTPAEIIDQTVRQAVELMATAGARVEGMGETMHPKSASRPFRTTE